MTPSLSLAQKWEQEWSIILGGTSVTEKAFKDIAALDDNQQRELLPALRESLQGDDEMHVIAAAKAFAAIRPEAIEQTDIQLLFRIWQAWEADPEIAGIIEQSWALFGTN